MMFDKRLFLLVGALVAGLWHADSQANWPVAIGGQLADNASVVKIGPSGNIYVAGSFEGLAMADALQLNSNGIEDIYVAKLSPGGTVLWVATAGGDSRDRVVDLALDETENVYITGHFFGTAFFGETALSSGRNGVAASLSRTDGFIARISNNGEWQWATDFGGAEDDYGSAVEIVPGNNAVVPPEPSSVFVGGSHNCTIDYGNSLNDGGTLASSVSGCNAVNSDIFLGRLNTAGEWQYAVNRAGSSSSVERIRDMEAAGDGRLFIHGELTPAGLQTLVSDFFNGGSTTVPTRYSRSDPSRSGISFPNGGTDGEIYVHGAGALNIVLDNNFDFTGYQFASLRVIVRPGADNYNPPSENPDPGDDFQVAFRNSDNQWQQLELFRGNTNENDNPTFDRTYILPANAFHADFQVRFRLTASCCNNFDYWHFDAVEVKAIGPATPFVGLVSNTLGGAGDVSFGSPVQLPEEVEVNDLHLTSNTSSLYLAGELTAASNYCSAGTSNPAAFVAKLSGSNLASCQWIEAFAEDSGGWNSAFGVTTDDAGNVYTAGRFANTVTFFNGDGGILTATTSGATSCGATDIFAAALTSDGNWIWASGGDFYDATDGVPGRAGGSGCDSASDIVFDGNQGLYVTGVFQELAVFGEEQTANGFGGDDGFVGRLTTDGVWFQISAWTVGEAVPPPPGAKMDDITFQPEFFDAEGNQVAAIQAGLFYFAPPATDGVARLIPLQEVENIQIHWRGEGRTLQDPFRIVTSGSTLFPADPCADFAIEGCFQVHVAGAPVEIQPPDMSVSFLRIVVPASGSNAAVNANVFEASTSGFSTLLYADGPTPDDTAFEGFVQVIRTVPPAAAPLFQRSVSAEIGKKILDPYHNEGGRSGYVLNETAFYDGSGPNAAYDRSGRTGIIVPVNRLLSTRSQDADKELVVAWYRRKATGVYWPEKPVSYETFWPLDPDLIVIASQEGGENLGQEPLDPLVFTEAMIYQQPDPDLAGYNPNDEHAFFAPSQTGTGLEAIFALRSDFGSNLDGEINAASDPYVIVKYRNANTGEWQYRVYEVQATGAGFNRFRFDGVAGSPVAPPYPVSLLPGCAESNVVGQATTDPQPPAPFFQDYKNQLWGTSAGSGQVRYFYPLQAGFFVDLDNDDVNDVSTGDCYPWLARLSVALGGAGGPSEPIRVSYDIVWPDSAPQLIPGETLLAPKRGLPDIVNQAAVQIAFDQFKDENPGAEPAEALAQLIDPLNPRFVSLEALPEGVASELDIETGGRIIISNSSGTTKLPVSIRDRLRYDSLNGRLSFKGIFDESGAGEPLLLLNVMSIREANILLDLDESNSSAWRTAIQALFRLTRNPNGVEFICTSSSVDPDSGERVCDSSRDITDSDVLVGVQDSNGDGVLEPFEAVGVRPALTAGFAQGSGFMTLVFNNDPSLNPLPVSLQVIRVDCLQSPPPPTPPEDADILSVYQGQLQVLAPENIFDEQLVLRHSGDFGGNPDALEFEWYYHPDIDGTPPEPLPSPETGQLSGWIQFPVGDGMGVNEISIEGANIQTLSDNWYVARYRGLGLCQNTTEWSIFAGQPGGTPLEPRAQLAEGWVKRVIKRLNPFEARVQDFAQAATNNFASMLVQLGERFEGPIALNNDPENLNSFGLIEAYTTVFRRAMTLSVDGTPPVNFDPANNAILLVASRLVDFYTLLGNEAYSDAQDPTIGITTQRQGIDSLAPTIFNFQNQVPSVLEEELVLMRGRDDSNGPVAASPVYNRFFWNFTTGDGEVAYQSTYNISDQNVDGVIDEFDARILYPQGHGDAWGHYLTALDIYYDLLRHPFFTWNPRAEAITVAGAPITVDFMDERQFAETAVAKARTGAEIVDLTYRSAYVEDPAGQWQGYKDIDPERAWGLAEWGRRAGQGAYLDWVMGNSILQVEEPDPTKVGIQRVDRSTVTELAEIQAHHQAIQSQVDEADQGLNPLGLAEGVVPFDIDPSQVDDGVTHFEQVFERAETALTNAVQVWDFANSLNQMLRRNQNTVDDLAQNSRATEVDFKNRLIETFGYPYADDIGPGGLYPAGYDGPDLYHYMFVDVNALEGTAFDLDGCPENATDCDPSPLQPATIRRFSGNYTPTTAGFNFFQILGEDEDLNCGEAPLGDGCALGEITSGDLLQVEYTVQDSELSGFSFVKPPEWTSQRRAPGKLQEILSELFSARIAMQRAFREYENLRRDVTDQIDTIQATFDIRQEQIQIANETRKELNQLTITSQVFQNTAIAVRRVGNIVENGFKTAEECVPDTFVAGFSNGGDIFAGVSCAVKGGGYAATAISDAIADGLDIVANATEAAKEDVSLQSGIESQVQDARLELFNLKGELDQLLRKEPLLRADIFAKAQTILDLRGKYFAALAEGQRTLQQLVSFRKNGAAAIQEYRYQDMAFRIFRNDALQKYRASYDLAARFVYLAATAYDYETNLLGTNAQAGQNFLTDIVRERSLGQILDGKPVPGSRGLADPMGRMEANFSVLKGQMGFNNPQTETNRFSLRRELFRISDAPSSDAAWRDILEQARIDNLFELQEFRRFARPFAPESAGPQPAIVIRFPTTVTFGLNYFGWELGPGDSTYDPTQFATKVRSAGVWFDNYDSLPLSNTPRVYLFPTGADVLRSRDPFDFETREWNVIDQRIPVPFQIGSQDLSNESWIPGVDSLIGDGTEIRRFSRFRAFHFSEPFDASQVISDSRLIGRSVWNREWMMIIPGETLLFDPDEGLDTFINGVTVPGSDDRDGQGVRDILLFFQTYAYSGN
ncbi:MAG: hypothetical protein R3200_08345 [Xanthomonadales bacterium]|nr:hypothetical protein [Xanthomonadales bacterium]